MAGAKLLSPGGIFKEWGKGVSFSVVANETRRLKINNCLNGFSCAKIITGDESDQQH